MSETGYVMGVDGDWRIQVPMVRGTWNIWSNDTVLCLLTDNGYVCVTILKFITLRTDLNIFLYVWYM